MSIDGKQLEALVAFVEKTLLPAGFDVKANERVFNEEGVQIAEFDIAIRGKIGSTSIAWLIECRDRPGHGPAPGSWIEQLVGRRGRFGFNKVTAVSTTGFASGAVAFANAESIELREVRSLDPSEFSEWLQITEMRQVRRITDLKHATIFPLHSECDEAKAEALELIARSDGNAKILESSNTGEAANLTQAFFVAVQGLENPFANVTPEHPETIRLRATYTDADHFVLRTATRSVKVEQIDFIGELRIEEEWFPVIKTAEYRHVTTGESISQLVAFAPQTLLDMKFSMEMHHMADTGETHIIARRLPNDA